MTTRAEDNPYPSILILEHVDPSAPAAGYQRAFIDTDHHLKLINSSSTVTDLTAGAAGSVATDAIWDAAGDLAVGTGADTAAKLAKGNAGGYLAMGNGAVIWNAGTSFPGSKATNDRYFRTDIRGGTEFVYDGTRWVSTNLFSWQGPSHDNLTGDGARFYFALPADYQIYVVSWDLSMYVTSTAVFVATLDKHDFEFDTFNVATKSSTGQTAAKLYHYSTAIGVVVDGTGGNAANAVTIMSGFMDLTSGSGGFWGGFTVFYRLIAT